MIAAMRKAAKLLAINWPLAWVPAHVTTKRLIDEGTIGEIIEGALLRRQPGARLWHVAGKKATTPEEIAKEKAAELVLQKGPGAADRCSIISATASP